MNNKSNITIRVENKFNLNALDPTREFPIKVDSSTHPIPPRSGNDFGKFKKEVFRLGILPLSPKIGSFYINVGFPGASGVAYEWIAKVPISVEGDLKEWNITIKASKKASGKKKTISLKMTAKGWTLEIKFPPDKNKKDKGDSGNVSIGDDPQGM